MYKGKVVMVTGGTGSFGNAFVKHLLKTEDVRKIIIFSRDEFKQYKMQQRFNDDRLRFFIGDVRDYERLSFAMKGVDYVFHAAAMKQVVASEYNPDECIKTNVLGTQNLVKAAIEQQVKRVIGVSTDKAVKPVNLYGATKTCMERLLIAGNHLASSGVTRFSLVRYGNVIGSRGSVIPLFREQAKTGKLTITHKDMTRFWLRIEDGVEFVKHCAEIMHGGEIFVKKLPSLAIVDLAKVIAPECEHVYIGIRPGEKLHEEMVSEEESLHTYEFEDMFVIQPSISLWDDVTNREYMGHKGHKVQPGMSYSSQNNPQRLGREELLKLLEQTEVVSH